MPSLNPIVFYISGHGFGHASRDVEVINALQATAPERPVVVRTAAPRWLFDLTLKQPVDFHAVECDTGVVQIDSLHLDEDASVRRAAAFHANIGQQAESEAGFLEDVGAALVVGDIPALAFLAAERAGVPSVALGNFTWDWIYEAYPEQLAGAPLLVPAIRCAHRHAAFALRLPMWGGFDGFREVRDIPFVARHATLQPETVRERLGLPRDRAIVLLSFGGYGLKDFDLGAFAAAARDGFALVTTDQVGARAVEGAGSNAVTVLPERAIYDAGCRYEDLVSAVDIVATKPGYGIIAECVANRTGMLYTSRGRFAEYEVLAAAIPRYLRSAFIPHADLYSGRWAPYLEAILHQVDPSERPATNGAEIAARAILEVAGSSKW